MPVRPDFTPLLPLGADVDECDDTISTEVQLGIEDHVETDADVRTLTIETIADVHPIALLIEGEAMRGRALVVEDAEDAREILVAQLEAMGYEVRAADGVIGAIAIGAGLEWVPDLVVTDLHMPKFDGLTAVRMLRMASAFPNLPLVVVSGVYRRSDESGVVADLIAEGAVFVEKGARLSKTLGPAIDEAIAIARLIRRSCERSRGVEVRYGKGG